MKNSRDWKKIGIIMICVVLFTTMLLGCGPKEVTITVANDTGWTLSELYIASIESDTWGQNYLTRPMNDQGVLEITLDEQADTYDIEAVNEYGDELDFYDVPLEAGGGFIIVDDGDSTYLEVSTKKGGQTIYDGIYTPAEELDDGLSVAGENVIPEEDAEYAEAEEAQTEQQDDWIELTVYNETDLTINEVYAYEMDSDDYGYNHIEATGEVAPGGAFDMGVDWYP
ncbi:hypothetical protein LJC56_11940, partial [Christensenellaceae bacterium OttesenSCG-928-K19]|nr:hypothetical protein [Christensenellaceae bacterium OttesenSCG-928-K19]